MSTKQQNIREEFDEKVPSYSMNEYGLDEDKIRPLMVQREDAINFFITHFNSKMEGLAEKMEELFKTADEREDMVEITDVLSIINNHKEQ